MIKTFSILVIIYFTTICSIHAQTALSIPDTLSGNTIDLFMSDSSRQFVPGFNTSTIGYNGSYLGPTIILNKGQQVTMNVHNQLADTTTTHWHGLHVAPMNDGSPHTPIMAGSIWSPSFTILDNAALYWYHPHLHGKTLSQVVKGAAGLIIVRDSLESTLDLPRSYGIDDFPLVFQWQHMDSTTKQIILNDELDNITMINGQINVPVTPFLEVPAQVVRLRLLNASSHRFIEIGFDNNMAFHQITTDDGLLNAPVTLTRLMLGSGERAEILVDFQGQNGNTFYIRQYGTELPAGYPGGPPSGMGASMMGPLDNTDFNLLQLDVVNPTTNPVISIPTTLTTNTIYSSSGASNFNVSITASPMMSMTNFLMNGVKFDENVINMTTTQERVMTWTITNQSMMPHPFHIHGNHFYVLSINGATPPANMLGPKDVVVIPPQNGSVVLITKYKDFNDPVMPYMFHCHILSHEDNGMMGQFIVNPAPTGILPVNKNDDLYIYPNPVNDFIYVERKMEQKAIGNIEITDLLGNIVYRASENGQRVKILVADFSKGTYIIKVENGQFQTVSRFQKIE